MVLDTAVTNVFRGKQIVEPKGKERCLLLNSEIVMNIMIMQFADKYTNCGAMSVESK